MTLGRQFLLVNGSILAGLLFERFWGATPLSIAAAGVVVLLLANTILFVRFRKSRKTR